MRFWSTQPGVSPTRSTHETRCEFCWTNVPAPLRRELRGHTVETAFDLGWAGLTNGELLTAAQRSGFELLITTDRGIRHQQNLRGREIAIPVLSTNDWARIRRAISQIVPAIASTVTRGYVELDIPL